ncbi:MAG: hypothetical protein AAFU55_00045 [Pseudomonadota bacterium]
MKTILLQSHKPPPWPRWIERCVDSAAAWARRRSIPSLFLNDELFEDLPPEFLRLTAGDVLPRTDIGRLLWMRRLHDEGWERVIWLDADVLVFDDRLAFDGDAVGKEAWVTGGGAGAPCVTRKVNNCVLCFDAGSAHLARYLDACLARAASLTGPPGRMAFGPDLMTELHLTRSFPLHPDVAMFSPRVLEALAAGGGPALDAHQSAWGGAPMAANLCASLSDNEEVIDVAVDRLLSTRGAASRNDGAFTELPLGPGRPLVWA